MVLLLPLLLPLLLQPLLLPLLLQPLLLPIPLAANLEFDIDSDMVQVEDDDKEG